MSEPQYLVDSQGKTTAVRLDLETYNTLVEAAEELEDIRSYDEAKRALDAGEDELIPFDQALAEIEAERGQTVGR